MKEMCSLVVAFLLFAGVVAVGDHLGIGADIAVEIQCL